MSRLKTGEIGHPVVRELKLIQLFHVSSSVVAVGGPAARLSLSKKSQ
jgi:hypothetical protein